MLIVGQALVAQMAGQDGEHHAFPAVQVLFELLGVLMLLDEDPLLLEQRLLWRERQREGRAR